MKSDEWKYRQLAFDSTFYTSFPSTLNRGVAITLEITPYIPLALQLIPS